MKKRWVILNAALLMLFPGVLTSHQNVPTGAEKSDRQRHQFAVSLLRTINTAEAVDKTKFGSYSSWQTPLSHHSEYFVDGTIHEKSLRHIRFVRVYIDKLAGSQNRCGKQNSELSFLGHCNPCSLDLLRVEAGIRFYFLFQTSQNSLTVAGARLLALISWGPFRRLNLEKFLGWLDPGRRTSA